MLAILALGDRFLESPGAHLTEDHAAWAVRPRSAIASIRTAVPYAQISAQLELTSRLSNRMPTTALAPWARAAAIISAIASSRQCARCREICFGAKPPRSALTPSL